MTLPVNVDSTYADSGTDASVKLHQQHHDTIHGAVNGLPATYAPLALTGLLSAMPANGAVADGSMYFATDQNGGTAYLMVAGVWQQIGAGVTQASGAIIAGPVSIAVAQQVDVKAIGTTHTDVAGMSLNVPASARPVLLRAKFETQQTTGTAAINTINRLVIAITDAAGTILDIAIHTATQGSAAASITNTAKLVLEAYLPAPVAAATYKIQTYLVATAPANWGTAAILPGYTTAGVNDNFYAQAA